MPKFMRPQTHLDNECVNQETTVISNARNSATTSTPDQAVQVEAADHNEEVIDIHPTQTDTDQALHSGPTGPRSELGKQKASQNAISHGILSKATVLKDESPDEYQLLVQGFSEAVQPVGTLEELLVEKLASLAWRYRRSLLAEGAEIRKHSEFVQFDKNQKERIEAEEIAQKREPRLTANFESGPFGLIWDIHNSEVLARCVELLDEMRYQLETFGLDYDRDRGVLLQLYGKLDKPRLHESLHEAYLNLSRTANASERVRESKGYYTPAKCRQLVIQKVGAEFVRLKEFREKQAAVDSERMKVEILRQGVPDSPAMDRILRYQTTLEKAFDRTLSQIERLQRIRKGLPVLPPVKLEIN